MQDEVVVVDPINGIVAALNPAGALLWDHLWAGEDAAALVVVLMAGHGLEETAARRDVAAFLDQLVQLDLLER